MKMTWAALAAVVALAPLGACSELRGGGPKPSATPLPPATANAKPMLAPGRFGPVTVGMTKQEAIATGLLAAGPAATPEDVCPPPKLVWTPPYDQQLDVQTTMADKIASIGTLKKSVARTTKGIGVGSTLADVKQAYPNGTLKTSGVGYDQSGYIVEKSGKYLGFLFNATTDASPVVFIEVTRGNETELIRDGC